MKLNCDLGESYGLWQMGQDAKVMPYIDQANIACGFHAGDPVVIMKTLQLAKKHNVSIGAHPSYPDLVGFGRRAMKCTEEEILSMMLYQISAVDGMAKSIGLSVDYVKPHGALYNDMMKSEQIREALFKAMAQYNSSALQPLKLMMQATVNFDDHQKQAHKHNVSLLAEAFADRCYGDDGRLLSRQEPNALHNKKNMLEQVKQLAQYNKIITVSGNELHLKVDSICVHGDNPQALESIELIQGMLA